MVLAVLGVVGCAGVAPPRSLPPSTAPAAWQQAPAQSATVAAVEQAWWTALGDPLLNRLVDRAAASAPDVRTAGVRLREARARRDLAQAGLGPSVSGSASASRSRSSGATGRPAATSNLVDAGFDASWEVDLFGRLHAGSNAAESDLAAAQASLGDVRVSLRAEAARNYLELRGLQARLAIARHNLDLQGETLQIAQWRAQAGLVSVLDVEQAQANREQTRSQSIALQRSLVQSQQALELLLGEASGALQSDLQATQALPALPASVGLPVPADVLRQRADVRTATEQWLAEAARTDQAQANLYPKLTLSGSIGWQALTLGSLGDGATASVLAGLTAPIFDAGRLRAQLAAQTAVQDRLAVAYEKAVLAALSEVEGALVALAASREQAQALGIAAASAREAATLARARYDSGLIDFRTVLDAERSVLSAEDSLATARSDGLAAWIRLYKALGGGWQAPTLAAPDPTGKTS